MVRCGFILDIIVVRIDAPDENFEDPCKLEVDVQFRKVSLKITSSRINVVGFRSGRSYEFDCDPAVLKRDLKEKPLEMTVKYDNCIVGYAQMEWPDHILCQISDSLGELTHVAECPMLCGMPDVDLEPVDDEETGRIEIIVRLQSKCQELLGKEYKSFADIRQNLDKVIDPNDLLFVVGQENKDDDCTALMTEMGGDSGHRTALDLSPYRMMHGKKVPKADILSTCTTSGCPELKKMTGEYERLIDQLITCSDASPKKKQQRPCTAHDQFAKSRANTCPHENKSYDCSDESSEAQFLANNSHAAEHEPSDGIFAGEKLRTICPVEPMPALKTTEIQTPRCCPICKVSVKWLPKMACCPRCGYKPVPNFVEKPYDPNITASQILAEYAEKHSSEQACVGPFDSNICDDKCAEQSKCRCTCARGKVCAHCRIRKLCEDIFKSSKPGEKNTDECGNCEPHGQNYNLCQSSSTDCRPYLAKVFSEMRDLYNVKEPKSKSIKPNKRCESQLQGRNSENRAHGGSDISFMTNMRHDSSRNTEPIRSESYTGAVPKSSEFKLKSCLKCTSDHAPRSNSGEGAMTDSAQKENTEVVPTSETTPKRKRKPKKRSEKKNSNLMCPAKPQSTQNRNMKFSHKDCIESTLASRKLVPHNMGWLWNLQATGPQKHWRPGFIRKPIRELMTYFLKDFPADTLPISRYSYRKKEEKQEEEKELVQHPTLHLRKKNGVLYITLRPLKDSESLKHCADPYLKMKPITFKITKNPVLVEMRNIKRAMKEMGFCKCKCGQPIMNCYCRSFLEKKRLQYQVNKECKKRSIPSCNDRLVLDDTSDSDAEFDFGVTPPAGVIKPGRGKKPDLVHNGTQYQQDDWDIPPLFPKPLNRFMKLYNCATGERSGFPPGGRFGPGGPGGIYGSAADAAKAAKEKAKRAAAAAKAAAAGAAVKAAKAAADAAAAAAAGGAGGAGGPGGRFVSKYGGKGAKPNSFFGDQPGSEAAQKAAAAAKARREALAAGAPPILCEIERPCNPCGCYFSPCCNPCCPY